MYGSAICFEPYQYKPDQKLVVRYAYRVEDTIQEVDPAASGYDYTEAKQEYWHVPRDTEKETWTEPYFDEGGGNIVMSTFSVPFFRGGKFFGVATVDIPLEPLRKLVHLGTHETASFALLSKAGKWLYSPDPSRIGKSFEQIEQFRNRDDLRALSQDVSAGKTGSRRVSGWTSDNVEWVSYSPVKSAGFGLATAIDERQVLQVVTKQVRRGLLVLAVSALLIVASLWLLWFYVSRPISKINRTAVALSKGKLDARTEVVSGDEIGTLAAAFNSMAQRLAERETALRASEEKLRSVIEDLPIFLCRFLPNGEIIFANEAYCTYLGKTTEEVIGSSFLDQMPAEDRASVMTNISNLTAESPTQSHVHRAIGADGAVRWHRWTTRAILDARGAIETYQSFGEDVTKRKEAEKALRESEERMQLALSGADLGTWDCNFVTGEATFNDRWAEMLGYSLDELEPKIASWEHLLHPDDAARVQEVLNAHLDRRTEGYETEHRLRHKSGYWVWVLTKGRVIERDADGKPIRACGTHLDITERKQAEEALQENERKLREAQELAHIGNWHWNVLTGDVQWSVEVFRIFHLDPKEFRPQIDSIMALSPWPDSHERHKELMQRAMVSREPGSFEQKFLRPDGTIGYYLSTFRGVYNEDGDVIAMEGTVQDITDRKKADKERQEHIAFLRSLDQVNQAIQQADDVEHMLNEVVNAAFSIFECDRAWLAFPCDPQAETFRVPVEASRPEYPGVHDKYLRIPMEAGYRELCEKALETEGTVTYGPACDYPLGNKLTEAFGVQSLMGMCIKPKAGRPWMFGMHQCSEARTWTEDERRLFTEISNRVSNALSTLVILQNLRENEEKLSLALDVAKAGVWRWNVKTGSLLLDDNFHEILGYEHKRLPNNLEQWREYFHPDDVDGTFAKCEAHFRGDVPFYEHEHRLRSASGDWYWVFSRGRIVSRDRDDKPEWFTGVAVDVTDMKLAEMRLREAQAYISNIIDSMPSVLVGVDLDGRVTQWNAEAQRVTGLAAKDAVGQSLAQAFPRLASEMDRVREAIRTRRTVSDTKLASQEDRMTRYEDITVYPLLADMEGAVIRLDNVTERVRIEEIMVQTEKMLSVGGLAAGMAHEINNPLGGMMQAAQNIERRVSTEIPANIEAADRCGTTLATIRKYLDQREIFTFLHGIRECGARAAEIVSNMLQFSRKSSSQPSAVSIVDMINRSIKLAAQDYDLKKKYDFRHIEIVREFDDDLPNVLVVDTEIEQVLLNVLKNGAQAMQDNPPERPPKLTLRCRVHGPMLRIEVEDNGPGMSEETRKRVFEPFFTTKEVGSGTGLGLSVSYFIITENHGGEMEVESYPDGGARFIIQLPSIM